MEPMKKMDGAESGTEGPEARLHLARGVPYVLPMQPEPVMWQAAPTPDGRWTAAVRLWDPGDVARCRLCPVGTCVATERSFCVLQIPGRLTTAQVRLLDTNGMPRVRRG